MDRSSRLTVWKLELEPEVGVTIEAHPKWPALIAKPPLEFHSLPIASQAADQTFKPRNWPGIVEHTFNPSSHRQIYLWVQGVPGLRREFKDYRDYAVFSKTKQIKWGIASISLSYGHVCEVLSINDRCGKPQPTVGSTVPPGQGPALRTFISWAWEEANKHVRL